MGKRARLIHIHSNELKDGSAKLPAVGVLSKGEIAVNYRDGYETLSIENSNNEIVTFPSLEQVNDLIDKSKLKWE